MDHLPRPENCLLAIFGGSGDLTFRKLVPGLYNLFCRKLLPEGVAVLGLGRTEFSDDEFREHLKKGIREFAQADTSDEGPLSDFLERIFYLAIDTQSPEAYAGVRERLAELNERFQAGGNYLFYMSTPPSLFEPIATALGAQQLHREAGGAWRRLIVEKPFGYDLASARRLNADLQSVFREEQIYRIDHYLGKETVQNLLVLRFANGIYEPLWNRNYIEKIEITSAENIGVGSRGGYYDRAGALRDMFQNHLMHLVSMVAMEPPASFSPDAVRNESVKVFDSLRPLDPENIEASVIRGQYTAATVKGEAVKGYREEKGVPEDSRTETYVAVKFYLDNWRWAGVPFYVRTGKHLPTRVTEMVIHFKQIPHAIFGSGHGRHYQSNRLIIRIQPDEGILMTFNMKLPGGGFQVKTVDMDFHYADLADVYVPEAYERLLLDCMLGDATLYARGDAVEASWRFVAPILDAWQRADVKVYGYPAGTWGPLESRRLFDDPDGDWRYPCKNLASDGAYCEL